ncbi:MAG TPA: hypothetical protein VJ323_12145 [Bryobacteraceae bacterium]|jgi:hypothetical protein|nr:hypothetical protein [Bryobacteraceae bacterium]
MVLLPDLLVLFYLIFEDRFHWHPPFWALILLIVLWGIARKWYASWLAESIAEGIQEEIRRALNDFSPRN